MVTNQDFKFRLSESERILLNKKASDYGLKVSEYIRQRCIYQDSNNDKLDTIIFLLKKLEAKNET